MKTTKSDPEEVFAWFSHISKAVKCLLFFSDKSVIENWIEKYDIKSVYIQIITQKDKRGEKTPDFALHSQTTSIKQKLTIYKSRYNRIN